MQVGFTTLREFVIQRPSLRADSLKVLLELTTHPGLYFSRCRSEPLKTILFICADKVTRGAAIITVKRWVPDVQPMDGMIRKFALQILRKLQLRSTADQKPPDVRMKDGDQDENMEDGQLPTEALVQTPYLPERIELPAQKAHVLQHVELLFALSVKVPEFLDEYVFVTLTSKGACCSRSFYTGFLQHMDKWMLLFRRLFRISSQLSLNHSVPPTESF
jgi:symplekin